MTTNDYFDQEMKELLGSEYPAFLACSDKPMYKSLRLNPLKTSFDEIKEENIPLGDPVAFDKDTYYLNSDDKLGNHPFHLGGLYYLQEPSTTMVVNALDIQENDKVLDLCGAPGGKSTHILSKLKGTGLLWSNEIDRNRCQSLLQNLERWGSDNFILTNLAADKLCDKVMGYFDKVLVDAPCSGSSMFKKYPTSLLEYNLASELACQKRQLEILDEAYKALKENGILVYSTCTYNLYENEQVIEQFLNKHPDMNLVDTGN